MRERGRMTAFDEVRHVKDPIYPWFDGEQNLDDGVIYIVDGPRHIEFNCPCGCGNAVMIPFHARGDKDVSGWELQEREGVVTLSPSILSSGFECKSHYFIRENRVDWCG